MLENLWALEFFAEKTGFCIPHPEFWKLLPREGWQH